MKITKQVVFIAKDGCVEELKRLLSTMVLPSKASNGCELYDIFQARDESNKFIVVESWRDEKALDGHKASAHYAHYKSNFEQYCADKYVIDLDFI